MTNSTSPVTFRKPREDFPLFPHATGRWAKKVLGKFHYFGKVADDPKGDAAIGDDRLRAVTDHVHDWQFGKKKGATLQRKSGRQKAK